MADGKIFIEGDIVCLRMPQGLQMVRCSKVQNVTSWRKVQDGCPQASLTPSLKHSGPSLEQC
ncbi:MAG: hypothetical protein HC779_07980 [Phyllobacteriaceae bacterium]|nr:hypothetical protein [Phyllobacteriaceae bacterium]